MNGEEINNSQNSKKGSLSFADRYITAMFLPGEYESLLKLAVGKIITYIAFLVLLISLIQYGIPVMAAVAGYGGVRNYILKELPSFSLENGKFTVSEKLEKEEEDAGIYILVDTDKETFSKEDISSDMISAILISKNNIVTYNNLSGIGGFVQEQKFSEISNVTINNETVADMAPVIYFGLVMMYLLMYVITLIRYMFSALFYALILYIMSRIMAAKVSFAIIFKIALFAQTIGSIVSAVAYFIGTPVFVMAGSTFAMIVTVLIMNRAYFKIAPPPKPH